MREQKCARIKQTKEPAMLELLGKNLCRDFDYDFLKENIADFHYIKLRNGHEVFGYNNAANLLNEDFSIDLHFENTKLVRFELCASEIRAFEYNKAHSIHYKWLEENFGQYRTHIGSEVHYITDDYDFYDCYDLKSGSDDILVKVLR